MNKLWITLFLIVFNTSSLLASVDINLERSVSVNSEYLKLSDIATINGDNSAKIKNVFLGPSPRNGVSMTILRSDIVGRLKELGLDESINFTGSLGTSVSRGNNIIKASSEEKTIPFKVEKKPIVDKEIKTDLPKKDNNEYENYLTKAQNAAAPDLIRSAIRKFVADRLNSDLPIVMQTTVNRFNIDGNIGNSARVEGVERGKLPGRATLAIVFTNNSQITGYASVEVNIKMSVQIVSLARNIRKGTLVREQDLVLNNIDYKPDMVLENIKAEDIAGRIALKNIRSGIPLSAAYFGKPLDVEKGQMITVVVQGKGFSIKEMALALGSGNTGDTIKVESVVNKSVYPVRVTGRNQADMPINAL